MATSFNTQDCATGVLGTQAPACETDLGIMTGFVLVPRTWSVDSDAVDITGAYIKDQILAGNFHPFANALDFVQNSEETQFKTYNRGTQLPIRKGLPLMDFIYSNGYSFHAAAFSFDSYQRYKILFLHENGALQGVLGSDKKTISGFNLGFIDTATYKNADGAEPSETVVKMQLVDNNEYNTRKAIISFTENNISEADFQGIVQARLVLDAIAPGTAASVSVKAAFNSALNIQGLAVTNFSLPGNTVTAAVYNATTNKYDLTLGTATVAAESYTVSLTDGTNPAAEVGGVIYKGVSNQVIVA